MTFENSHLIILWLAITTLELLPLIIFIKTRRHFLLAIAFLGTFINLHWQKILWILEFINHPPLSSVETALTAHLFCTVLILSTYFGIIKKWKKRTDQISCQGVPKARNLVFIGIFLLLVFIPNLIQTRFFSMYFTLLWIAVAYVSTRDFKGKCFFDCILLGASIYFFLTERALFFGVSTLILSGLSALYNPSKRHFTRFAMLFLCLFLLHSQKYTYRGQFKTENAEHLTPSELFPVPRAWQVLQSFDLKTEYNPIIPRSMQLLMQPVRLFNQSFYFDPPYLSPTIKKIVRSFQMLLRLGEDSLERVFFYTPRFVPFWKGETYQPLAYFWVPRFLWQDKPAVDIWNRFGKTYLYFVELPKTKTSVTFNYMSEGYMNFGYRGMALASLAFSLLLLILERFLSKVPSQWRAWFAVVLGHSVFFPSEAYTTLVEITHTLVPLILLTLSQHIFRVRRQKAVLQREPSRPWLQESLQV